MSATFARMGLSPPNDLLYFLFFVVALFFGRLVWETRRPDGCARPKRILPRQDQYWPDFLCATEKDCEEAEREGMRALASLQTGPHSHAEKQQLPLMRKRRKIATQASGSTIFLSLFSGLDILLQDILLHLSRWWLADLLSGTLSRARARAPQPNASGSYS